MGHLLPVATVKISKLIKFSKLGLWNDLSALQDKTGRKYYQKEEKTKY